MELQALGTAAGEVVAETLMPIRARLEKLEAEVAALREAAQQRAPIGPPAEGASGRASRMWVDDFERAGSAGASERSH
jgi:hypothetical protein